MLSVEADLTHVDEQGRARMVDVGSKEVTDRSATAEAFVSMSGETRDRLFGGSLPKGDAIAVVRIAAIQAAKRTADLVPLCHPLPLTALDVEIEPVESGARIEVTASVTARTGVEMEAVTGAAVGAVTMYDMIKGIERGAEIGPVRLIEKSGGRSGEWRRE
jgi:cyclic pyranopterin phosphate synthase